MRIADYFDAMAEQQPDHVALIEGDAAVTFGQAQRFVHAVAHALDREPTLRPGGHVALYAPNHHRVPLLHLAINRSDHAWLSVHTRNSIEVNIEVLAFMDCELLFFHSNYEALVPTLRAGLPAVRQFICIDRSSAHGPSIDEWIGAETASYRGGLEDPLAASFIQPTGGTTGPSKAAVHTHRSLEMMFITGREVSRSGPGSRVLAVAPLTHAGGINALTTLCSGGTVVVVNLTKPDEILDAIERWQITHLFLPPTLLYMVMSAQRERPRRVSSLRQIGIGAAPVAPEKMKEATAMFGPVMAEGFGQTECGLPLIFKQPGDYVQADGRFDEAALASAGRATPFARVEIVDTEGRRVAPGQRGEVVVQAGTVMREYYKNPQETALFFRQGWGHTGDVGVKDARGFITIVDRLKDMIVTGGFNVFPAQIEAVVLEHPAVLECAVVGVPDPKWGEAVKAVVQLKPGHTLLTDELLLRVRARLGDIHVPKSVEIWPELPRSAVGKLLRREVRARYWKDQWRSV